MRSIFLPLLALLISLQVRVLSAETETPALPSVQSASVEAKPAAELSSRDAVVLGLVEGITEYLPISSTGHLIIATQLLKLSENTPLLDSAGNSLWYKRPTTKNPAGIPLTRKLAADSYTVIIQFGAIAAVAILYWRQLWSMFLGLIGKDAAGLRLLRNLLIAFIPAAALGLLLHSWIESLFSVTAVLTAQVAGAVLMILAEGWRKKKNAKVRTDRDLTELSAPESFGIGLLQCLALWPGMSRSMTTIVGGYFVGLNPRRSAEFSFLLGLVTLSAATGYKCLQSGSAMLAVFGWPHILLGCFVAAITAAVAVKFLVSFLTRYGLMAFAIYRLVMAGVLGLLIARGFF